MGMLIASHPGNRTVAAARLSAATVLLAAVAACSADDSPSRTGESGGDSNAGAPATGGANTSGGSGALGGTAQTGGSSSGGSGVTGGSPSSGGGPSGGAAAGTTNGGTTGAAGGSGGQGVSGDGGGNASGASAIGGGDPGGSGGSAGESGCGAHQSGVDCACDDGYVPDGSDCVEEACTPGSCSGHGACSQASVGITCECDEGFLGEQCDTKGSDYHRRSLLVSGLADPDIYKEDDNAFFLTGTAPGARTLPIYQSSDLLSFHETAVYDPSATDPAHDYCHVWAPDLSKYDGRYDLFFSAHQVEKDATCPPPSGQTVTTFHVSAPDLDFAFGIPELVDNGPGLPASRIASGCLSAGCEQTIRIDSAAYDDGVDRWFFYVWFQGGNNIAAYRFSDPGTLILNTGPAVFSIPGYEESINEGPDVLFRDGRYYLFFSGAFFDSQYAMYYVMADEVADLTRARYVRRHSTPLRNAAEDLVESHGHNSIVERRGEFFNVFHQGAFDDAGNLTGRSTYKQRIVFGFDGSAVALNTVDLRWSTLDSAQYSLDVVTQDGTVHGPCLAVGRLGTSTSARYGGICPDAGDAIVRKSDIAAFRLFYSTDGSWNQSVVAPYDGSSDRVFLPIAGGSTSAVALRWTELETSAEYSIDVQRTDGSWIAPCVGAATLGGVPEALFDGTCPAAAESVLPADIQAFRVCSAMGGDSGAATCGTQLYDGTAGHLDVAIPRSGASPRTSSVVHLQRD